jgi:hypothetical protein
MATQSTPASIGANFYALPEDMHIKLLQLQGLLCCLSLLTGTAAFHSPKGTPDMSNNELHHALWGMGDLLDAVMDAIEAVNEGEQA